MKTDVSLAIRASIPMSHFQYDRLVISKRYKRSAIKRSNLEHYNAMRRRCIDFRQVNSLTFPQHDHRVDISSGVHAFTLLTAIL